MTAPDLSLLRQELAGALEAADPEPYDGPSPVAYYTEFAAKLLPTVTKALEAAWGDGYENGSGDEAHYARGLPSDPGADEVPHDNPFASGDTTNGETNDHPQP